MAARQMHQTACSLVSIRYWLYPFTSPSQMLYRHFGVNRLALSFFDIKVRLMYTFGRS